MYATSQVIYRTISCSSSLGSILPTNSLHPNCLVSRDLNAILLLFVAKLVLHTLVRAHMKINCTGYEYKKRNCVLRLFCDRATVCMVPLSSLEFSGRRTYLRDRNCIHSISIGSCVLSRDTYQEKCVREESVCEYSPSRPSTGACSSIEYLAQDQRHNDPHELIS